MKKQASPKLIFIRKMTLLLTGIITVLLLTNCNGGGSGSSPSGEPTTLDTRGYDSLKYPIFILDSQTIADDPRLRQIAAHSRHLILKYRFNGIKNDTVDIDLCVYPSISHNVHGLNETPIILKHQDTGYVKLPDSLQWGNNYVNWHRIKGTILETTGTPPRRLVTNFGYIKFTPTNRDLGMLWDEQHLRFKITGKGKDGSDIILPPLGAGADDSHPSPPAPPGD